MLLANSNHFSCFSLRYSESGGMMKVTLWVTASLFLIINSCARVNKETKHKAEGHMKLGISYLSEGNLNAALKEFMESEKLYPDDPQLQNALGLTFFAKTAYLDSEKHFKKAIELKNDFSEAHNNLGVIYLNTNRYDDAVNEFRAALTDILYPTPERAYANIGWAYYKKKNFRDAEFNYKKALGITPDFFIAHFNLGLLYYDGGRYSEAVKRFKLAIKYYNKYAEAYYHLGKTYIKLKKAVEASQSFSMVCKLAPDSENCNLSIKYNNALK